MSGVIGDIEGVAVIGALGVLGYSMWSLSHMKLSPFASGVENLFEAIAAAPAGLIAGVFGNPTPKPVDNPQVSNNMSAIQSNTLNIANNTSAIQNNTDAIEQNTHDIATNSAAIAINSSRLDVDDTLIAGNAAAAAAAQATADSNTLAIGVVSSQVTDLAGSVSNLDTRVTDVEGQIQAVDNAVVQVQDHLDQAVTGITSRIDSQEEEIQSVATAAATNAAGISTNMGRIVANRADFTAKVNELNKRLREADRATNASLSNLEARKVSPGEYFNKDLYTKLVTTAAGHDDNLLASYATYLECDTGFPVQNTKDGLSIVTSNPTPDGGERSTALSTEDRVTDCMALQAWMDTEDANGRHWWRDVSEAQWKDIKDAAHKVALSNADFGWQGVVDADEALRYNKKESSYVSHVGGTSQLTEQRPFMTTSARALSQFNMIEPWKKRGVSWMERAQGYVA